MAERHRSEASKQRDRAWRKAAYYKAKEADPAAHKRVRKAYKTRHRYGLELSELGHFHDDPARLRAAAAYLESRRG